MKDDGIILEMKINYIGGIDMSNKKKVLTEIKSWIFSILGAFFIVVLLNSKVFARVQVQQSSMESTLFSNQQLIVDKLSYNFTEPKRGDIIIFLENKQKGSIIDDSLMFINHIKSLLLNTNIDKKELLVKRVIGVPGDEVNIKDGYVYINGQRLNEPYVKEQTVIKELKLPIRVGENKLFVLGDNRPVSKDSRVFGLIDYKQVEGKALYRIFPLNKIGAVK